MIHILSVIFFLVAAYWGIRSAQRWARSFERWQREEKEYHYTRRELSDRLVEWRLVAYAIDHGQHPYKNLSDALTYKLSAFANGMIIHLQNEIGQLDKENENDA